MKYKLKEIAQMCEGKLFGNGEKLVETIFLDSRENIKNSLFVAIIGEKVDAHNFIDSVFEKGTSVLSQKKLENPKGDYILVDDTIKALQKIARVHRDLMNTRLVGITGSVGKTTTKEFIALAIENQIPTLKTAGNANSQVGLPLTLLRLEKEHNCGIIEMGMSLPGEMERLSECARVNFAVVTNIGVSHIEFHNTKENIMREKLHITDKFDENSILFINADDELLGKEQFSFNTISFGLSENCNYRAVDISENNGETFFNCLRNGEKIKMQISVLGEHNIRNALVALAVAETLGLDTKKTVQNISTYKAVDRRQEMLKTDKFTIINDSYNASPDSMKTALDVLCKLEGRKIAIMADVLELGEYSQKGHSDVGFYAKEKNIDFLLCFGNDAKYMYEAFGNEGKSAYFKDYNQAEKFIQNFAKKGDNILVKGSRGMKTERFAEKLIKNEGA